MKFDSTQPGQTVGARRWPYAACHPSAWLEPHKGVLLSVRDTRAWVGERFGDAPDKKAVSAHVEWCVSHGLLSDTAPVMWDFTSTGGGYRILWERVSQLRPYVEDYTAWVLERAEARAQLSISHHCGVMT